MSRERGNQMAKKNEEVNEETLDKETEKTAEPKEAEKSNEEVLEEKLKEQTDKYMRLYAEYDNYQKRSQREKDMRYGDAVIDTVGAILSIGDNLERALATEVQSEDGQKMKDGIENSSMKHFQSWALRRLRQRVNNLTLIFIMRLCTLKMKRSMTIRLSRI